MILRLIKQRCTKPIGRKSQPETARKEEVGAETTTTCKSLVVQSYRFNNRHIVRYNIGATAEETPTNKPASKRLNVSTSVERELRSTGKRVKSHFGSSRYVNAAGGRQQKPSLFVSTPDIHHNTEPLCDVVLNSEIPSVEMLSIANRQLWE
jgi:hypothetical protein